MKSIFHKIMTFASQNIRELYLFDAKGVAVNPIRTGTNDRSLKGK